VGNVAYDPVGRQMLVAVPSDNTLAAIEPASRRVNRRLKLTHCHHDHGLAVDPTARVAFVACDGNATLLTVNLRMWAITGSNRLGEDPDVLSYDAGNGHLWVAAESGWLTILARRGQAAHVIGSDYLADGAHVVAADATSHNAYLPIPKGPNGHPTLLYEAPTS
jgi:DNA-binding beta-propeller fold protein YncE